MPADLLATIERYYDAVPRATARTETVGPLTLFVAERGWPYYARPRLAGRAAVTAADVGAVRARQRQLGVPQQLEWVDEVTPSLAAACAEGGLVVHRHPLLVLEQLRAAPAVEGVSVRLMQPGDADLRLVRAAVGVGFRFSGTSRGTASVAERDAAAQREDPSMQRHYGDLVAAGLLRVAGAFCAGGAVGGGSHSPRDGVTEITGVALLPAYRRQGIGASLTAALVSDARRLGVTTIFCSADSDEVARVYERVGFRRTGTACVAEPAAG
jgi:ribosomal protein S18 acetylase RimI-like enzyme